LWENTVAIVTSDHGESLGEHGYYFDHGEDVFDPSLRIPLLIRVPGIKGVPRTNALASNLDLLPTILDAVKVSYPPDVAGTSLLPALRAQPVPGRDRLFARNDRNLSAAWDERLKIVATPGHPGPRFALYDRMADPGEARDVARQRPEELRTRRREIELFLERGDREWTHTRGLVGEPSAETRMTPEACANLKSLGYVVPGCKD